MGAGAIGRHRGFDQTDVTKRLDKRHAAGVCKALAIEWLSGGGGWTPSSATPASDPLPTRRPVR